jgi:hypothetical protein
MNGVIADHDEEWFDNEAANKFEDNEYVVPDLDKPYFVVRDRGKRFSELPEQGMEQKAKVTVATRKPLKLECPK